MPDTQEPDHHDPVVQRSEPLRRRGGQRVIGFELARTYDFDEASASAGKVERISASEGSDMGSTV